VLVAAVELKRVVAPLPARPRLREVVAVVPDLRAEATAVLRHVGPDGRLDDDASPELRRLRQAVARVGERLRRQLESFVHDPAAATVVRDAFVTQRNGRFVVPLRADAPRQVRGIVHGASSSGATLFVEPMESVELNNELVQLVERELEEQERVLRGWADRFRARLPEVRAALDAVVRMDTLQARALWGADLAAVAPAFVEESEGFHLEGLRHPLLDKHLREMGHASVPLTLALQGGDRVLVLSGPNAGGKTVALKALGLAVLAAQAGIPVPATQARLPVFARLRADIGDHQSIEADLSTFSAHVQAVARFLGESSPPCLVLFDEIGTGTEPNEGAAIARAVLEELMRPGVTTLATTHLGPLKTWALSSPGVASAAMEFDTERLRPTYRVLLGVAGVSAGLEIAQRMGVPDLVLAKAREHLGPEAGRSENAMDRLRALTSELEARTDAVAAREAALAEEARRLASRAQEDAAERRREAEKVLGEAVRELKEQGSRELAAIKDKALRARLTRDQARAEMRLQARARTHKARVGTSPPLPLQTKLPERLDPGHPVLVRWLERAGTVVEARERKVIVRLGTTTFAVERADLAPVGAPAPQADARSARGAVARLLERRAQAPPPSEEDADEVPAELMLLGKTVEEALEAVDRFLDASVLAGRDEVRIVHGHGTGRLRSAIRAHLQKHVLVAGKRAGAPNEGGDGATVVTLRA
jgi:DNA mismatch repair protein MutS2